MTLKDPSILYSQALSKGQAIALFRLPGEEKVNSISGQAVRKIKAGEKAFAFAPFDKTAKPYYIILSTEKPAAKIISSPKMKSTSKKVFTDYVKAIKEAINAGELQKAVAARVQAVDHGDNFKPVALFNKLCKAYPNAFVSLTYIPEVGLWIGASPEVLVSQGANSLTTYSLAGTKASDDNTDWTAKEKEEQRIVSDFIHQKLKKLKMEINAVGPATNDTGKLKHLLTVFTLRSKESELWQKVIKALHPTPAVAGMSQAKSIGFIKEHELFDRRFYAGYLGPVNWSGKTNVFVNLRCMEVTDKQLLFYAGCGVTADSDPTKEWLESERKIDVLKSFI